MKVQALESATLCWPLIFGACTSFLNFNSQKNFTITCKMLKLKLILNIMDVRAGKKKVPTGRGQDGDLVHEKATKRKN